MNIVKNFRANIANKKLKNQLDNTILEMNEAMLTVDYGFKHRTMEAELAIGWLQDIRREAIAKLESVQATDIELYKKYRCLYENCFTRMDKIIKNLTPSLEV